jgi:serine/threonine-protein kinase
VEDTDGLAAPFAVGSRVAGYRLEEQIGAGGMAVVFRARDERLGRLVALKVLAPGLAADEAFRQRFIRESRAAATVDDPHIIPVYEAGEADGVLFIAMRYVPGGDVRAVIRRAGHLSPRRATGIISAVASALDAAHAAGLVHRDVKPANMLLDARPGRPAHVYLSDFGLSKGELSSVDLTGSGQFLGTPSYSAPEQIQGKSVDGQADQYSLACAAFELLSGEPPFRRAHATAVIWAHMSEPPPPLSSRLPGLPRAVDGVFGKALAKEPDNRYRSCREFADALRKALGRTPYGSESGPRTHARYSSREVARPAVSCAAGEDAPIAAHPVVATDSGSAWPRTWPGTRQQSATFQPATQRAARHARANRFKPPAALADVKAADAVAAGGDRLRASAPAGMVLPASQKLSSESAGASAVSAKPARSPAYESSAWSLARVMGQPWVISAITALVLVMLIIGGGYLGWRYTQDRYYVGTYGGQVAIFQGVNQSVAGVNLSHMYRMTSIPLTEVPSPYRGQIRSTVSAASRGQALAIVANVRTQYLACQTAYQAEANYQTDLSAYKAAKAAYLKQWHNLKVQRTSTGKVIARPPKFTQTQPSTPAGCPASDMLLPGLPPP